MQTDRELMDGIMKGETQAFEVFFARYRDVLRVFVGRMIREQAAAEDVVQEVFLRVWTRAEQWQDKGEAKAWLFRIATNLTFNHLRTVRRRRQCSLENKPAKDNGDETALPGWMIDGSAMEADTVAQAEERRELFHRLIGQLPEGKRNVMNLVSKENMDIREAADALGIPEGTAKSRLYYAIRDMARELKDMGIEMEDL
jgi:RNA polymerase sigma-70 factor, ECF subfamily